MQHDLLFSRLSERINDERLLPMIRLWVKMGKVDERMRWKDTVRGIPQGSSISPLLSNLYLHPFDRMMVERQFGYVRYADNFIILSRTEGEAYRALKDTKWFLEKRLKLSLNPGSSVKNIQDGFEFLGILFRGLEKTVSKEKMEKLKERISEARDLKKEKSVKALVETIEGISRYYGRILPQDILEELDEWMAACLKSQLNKAYQDGLFEKKDDIKTLLSCVNFISQRHQLFSKRALKGIIAYCSRRSRETVGDDVARPIKKDLIKKRKREY